MISGQEISNKDHKKKHQFLSLIGIPNNSQFKWAAVIELYSIEMDLLPHIVYADLFA